MSDEQSLGHKVAAAHVAQLARYGITVSIATPEGRILMADKEFLSKLNLQDVSNFLVRSKVPDNQILQVLQKIDEETNEQS